MSIDKDKNDVSLDKENSTLQTMINSDAEDKLKPVELNKDKVDLNKDKVELNKDKVELNKDKVELNKDKVDLNKDKVDLNKDKVDLNKDKVDSEDFDKTFVSNKNIKNENIQTDTYSEDDFVADSNEQSNNTKDFLSAMFSKNPVFVLMLGLGPALAVTTKLTNGIGLGLIVLITTLLSNITISSLKGFIPAKIRLPFYLTITGSFVSVIIIFVQTFFPDLAKSLGIFLPLTAVNSVILERAEVFSCKKKIVNALINSLGTGIGFMLVLILISFIREFLGTLQLDFSDFGLGIYGFDKVSILGIPIYEHAKIFVMPAGAFLTLGLLLAIKQAICNCSNKNIEE